VVRVTGFDHLVLDVADAEASLRFYGGQLGLELVRVEEWRRGAAPFPSVRVDATTIIDLLERPRRGENVDHFCLVVSPTDFAALKEGGRFDVEDGPDRRFGAQGDGISLYVRDPDHNLVELRYYERT